MTIKQQGGIFGRHPEFSTIAVTDGADMSATAKPVQTLDRSDDGDIIRLEVNGSYVGAIGGRFGDLTIGTGSIGFRFDNTTRIVPWNMNTNLATNGVMDLGVTGAAFKNLYLTENVVIGTSGKGIDFSATAGAGTSELFDDYEEGTWTPTTAGDATGVIGANNAGFYVKTGRLVHVQCQFIVTTNFTSNAVGGLPYQPYIQSPISGAYGMEPVFTVGSTVYAFVTDTTTNILFASNTNGTAHNPSTTGGTYRFQFTYVAAE